MTEAVRHAEPADAARLADLETDAREAMARERGGPERLAELPERGRAGWEAALADPDQVVLLATYDGIPLGFLGAGLDRGVLRIAGIWVEPDARELGLGEELLTTAIDAAVARGASAVEAVALPGDRATKNLFERFAVKARAIVVHRSLDDW